MERFRGWACRGVRNGARFAPFAAIAVLVFACLAIASPANAAEAAQPDIVRPTTAPTAAPTRIDAAEAPDIDADLSDAAWAKAAVIDDLRQSSPNTGDPGTERTVVRIMYDENNLYFGVYAYDSTPDEVLVRGMARDGNLNAGDFIRIVLDPGATRRDGYSFQVGASGGRVDSIIQNNSTNINQWDAIWVVRAQRVVDGWIAEVAIPFHSLAYERDLTDWGFEFSRQIRHKNENLRWANFSPNIGFTDLTVAGTLTGITDIAEGLGLDVRLYGKGQYARDWQVPESGTISGTGGANVYYKITPALTGTLTFNPDFSDAPLDNIQINTTRFSLFTAETRDFFIQDAAAYEYGGLNFAGGGFGGFGGNNNGRPFFSRNFGLAGGTPVTILGGGKLSGSFAGFGVGAITALTEELGDTPRQVLSVARLSRPVLAESKLGFIFTNGDPKGEFSNTTIGSDFQYRNSNFLAPDKIFRADAFYTRSFTGPDDQDDAFGLALAYPNEPWGGDVRFMELGENFDPRLGFANRLGIRQYVGNFTHTTRFRNSAFRMLEFSTENEFVTNLKNHLESRENQAAVNVQLADETRYMIELRNTFEEVPVGEDFELPGGVPVPAGKYTWPSAFLSYNGAQAQIFQFSGNVTCCAFYDGTQLQIQANLNYRPNVYLEFGPRYNVRFIDMPTGKATVHVVAANATINFTPDMQLAFQAQWDNNSDNFGSLIRYRWEFAPGDELFVAFGQGATIDDRGFTARGAQFTLRVGHTFQF